MEKILKTKQCKNCGQNFPIMEKDQEFYAIMDVPEPTLCYLCRIQRRLSYRNERFLYRRKCGLSGIEMISSFSEDKPFPVYDNDVWWTDRWSALDYGKSPDFNCYFFEQFFELRNRVPRLARQQQKPMWNSDYCNCASQNRNCYLVFSTNRCEDCYYGSWVNDCKDCIDGKNIINCELCYDCVNCYGCYDLKYSQDSTNCKNSAFLRDCKGCVYCFACSNLADKKYYIFNKQQTKDQYEDFLKRTNMGSYKVIKDGKEKAQKMLQDLIVKEFHGTNLENCIGDYLHNCKNAYMCFECDDCEDVRYCLCIEKAKSSMDHSHWGGNSERIYECQACGYDLFNLKFCNLCWTGCSDLIYCDQCFSCKNCFGCVGLKKMEYCIFNKQYSKEEYGELVSRIIVMMRETMEYGEFFPTSQSCYAYNETLANEEQPLTKEEVIRHGWQWKDRDEKEYKSASYLPADDIKDIDDNIVNQVLACEICGKNYKIILQELNFYRRQIIPIPNKCPDCRHQDRLALRNGRVMYERKCIKCSREIMTTYAKDRPETIYCEKCYLETVY